MKPFAMLFITTLWVMTTTCDLIGARDDNKDPKPFERRELPRELDTYENQLIDGSTWFGMELMQQVVEAEPGSNHFVSPLSIVMAIGMLLNGAEGETYEQIQEMLGLEGMDRQQINEAARSLTELLTTFDDQVTFQIANSIWYRNEVRGKAFDVNPDFIRDNQEFFNALIQQTDFNDPATVDMINNWVAEHTEGLIEEIVEGPIDPLTVMYLINAIYFNGEWTIQFDPKQTGKSLFILADGSSTEVDMMRLAEVENMQYATGSNWQGVNLYYGDAGFAMTLVLPDEQTAVDEWIRDMDRETWNEITRGYRRVTIDLEMPKFELEYEMEDLAKVLESLGMVDAFYPELSDFSRINPEYEDLYVSDARHKTFIRVDEEGTEAAAVTSVEIGVTSAPQRVQIRFDRPYFYVIREVESNSPLFMGVMNNPAAQ